MIDALTSILERIQVGRWQSDQNTRIEIEHDLRKLVADHYLGWGKAEVPADYDGKNEGWVYVQNGKLPAGYALPPKGAISPYLFTPQFPILSPGGDLAFLRFFMPLKGLISTYEQGDGSVFALFRGTDRRAPRDEITRTHVGHGTHRYEHVARLLAVLYAHLSLEMNDVRRCVPYA